VKCINEIAGGLRPVGRVVYIKESPSRKSEIFVTLIALDPSI
jgi:hypothetical protein